MKWALLLIPGTAVSFVILPTDATSEGRQGADTVVVRVGSPQNPGVGRLIEELTIGGLDASGLHSFGSVASVAVGPNESIYVADEGTPVIRQFDRTGKYVRDFGRRGSGPGEYGVGRGQMGGQTKGPRGIDVFDDGRLIAHSYVGRRVNIYGPRGEAQVTRSEPRLYYLPELPPSPPLVVVGPGDTSHVRVWWPDSRFTPSAMRTRAPGHYVRLRPDGSPIDTLAEPIAPNDPPFVYGGSKSEPRVPAAVPFAPIFQWTLSRRGYFVTGMPNTAGPYYYVDLRVPPKSRKNSRWIAGDGVVRLQVPHTPIALNQQERADWIEAFTAYYRQIDRGWRWNATPVPEHKPAFRGLWVDNDGRIWVRLSAPAVENRSEKRQKVQSDGSPSRWWARDRWLEPERFDIVEPSGRYVGQVALPSGVHPQASRGNTVWAIVDSGDGPLTVKRFRIAW